MRGIFLFLVLAIFGNGSANADYIPGRVRAHVMADMKVEVARGVFLGMRLLKISLNYEDGRPQPVSFSVTAKADASPVTLKINEVRKSECGSLYEAIAPGQAASRFLLELKDDSKERCQDLPASRWVAQITLKEADGNESYAR